MKELVVLMGTLGILLGCKSQETKSADYKSLRQTMVTYQIQRRGITDSLILKSFSDVERHLFVPPQYRHEAYEDYPLPIGDGQTISQPYIVAFMTDVLNVNKKMRILEIGTGSGYQAAILSALCDSVFTIEIFPSLGKKATAVLSEKGYGNVLVKIGDGYRGWEEKAPFDAIIVTCAPSHIPLPLQEQLADGGRMIIPVGSGYSQELILLSKKKGVITQQDVLPVRFVPMIKKSGKKY